MSTAHPVVLAAAPSIVPTSLTRAADAAAVFDRFPQYRAGMRWVNDFVTQGHPDLGRSGAVCPRLAPAIRSNTVWLVALTVHGTTPSHAADAGRLLLEMFENIADEPHRSTTALLGFFPNLPGEHAAGFIDGGHSILRPEAVQRGLMLGEFHADSTLGGVHNRTFPVMRCPEPMFAVRTMTPHDLLFADQPGTPHADRLSYLLAYRRHVGPRLSPAAREGLEVQVSAAREALSSEESS
ncbi:MULTISPECIES: DUF6875 domain-containing protein [Streptomyces]|uniref:DUF6875 domain-containing protein n=1 Tax=Streptomyces TaxID=1883 RepID=UPI00093A75A4|nr:MULTISPECIES: hypothetical protein [unclassified Streptomyces]OKJ06434.1 hypothetical protein AMK20_29540 [Streptomyces sp. TSRI0261]QNQ35902.1 hypothetical protein HYC88_20980 [Streptomyces sp. CB00271]